MDKRHKKILADLIDDRIKKADEMWDKKTESPAYIVGYLTGVLKAIRDDLNSDLEK